MAGCSNSGRNPEFDSGGDRTVSNCAKPMDECCFMNMSESEQLFKLKQLIVSGKLSGELPFGFLACFRDLPNELIVKIWSFLPVMELRKFRLVSKHWKSLWERLQYRRKTITKLSISCNSDGKLVLKAIGNTYFGRQLEVLNNEESMRQAFSLITFPIGTSVGFYTDRYSNNCLIINDEAANDQVLKQIARQKWTIQTVVFAGNLLGLKEESLYHFLQNICLRITESSRLCLHFQNATLPPHIITDAIIEVCDPKLLEIIIGLNPSCIKNGPMALTNACLRYLFRDEVMAVLPSCPQITTHGMKLALQAFFNPTRKEQNTGASESFSGQTISPRMFIGISGAITARKVAGIKIFVNNVVVARSYHSSTARGFHRGSDLRLKNLEEVGIVEFTHKDPTLKEYKTSMRRYSIEVAGESSVREYADSVAVYDVAVHSDSQDSDELPTYGCPTDISDMYDGFNTPDNWSDDYDYDDYDNEDELDYDNHFYHM